GERPGQTAVSTLIMIGTANRMYALDHNGTYLTGIFSNASNSTTCSSGSHPLSNLVGCKYIASDDWNNKDYIFTAADDAAATNYVARASRRSGAYSSWAYTMNKNSAVTCSPACGGTNGPPAPSN
ncbi:MAG: hypothetical protein WC881_11185, partial [Elusimicrobiota bacterium]